MIKIIIALFFTSSALTATLDFNEVIDLIKERDTDLYARRFDLKAAKSERTSGRLGFLPTLNLGHEINRAYKTDQESNRSFLSAGLNIFNGGRDYYQLTSTSLNLSRAQENLLDTEIKTEREAVDNLVEYIQQTRAHEITMRQMTLAQDIYRAVSKRFDQGLGPRQERDKAQVDALNAEAQVTQAQITKTRARGNILQLLDIEKEGHKKEDYSITTQWPWNKRIKTIKIKSLKEAQYLAMLRPRTKALKFDYDREIENSKGNRSLFIPQIDLTYTWSRQEITKNINPFLVGFNQSDQTALLSFSFPLFNQYKDVATYKRQKAQLANSHALLVEAKREDYSQWISIKERLINALITVRSRLKTLELGKRIYQTSYKRFRAGRATVNDLAIDQNRLFQSENLANEGLAQFHLLMTEFCHQQGKLIRNCLNE